MAFDHRRTNETGYSRLGRVHAQHEEQPPLEGVYGREQSSLNIRAGLVRKGAMYHFLPYARCERCVKAVIDCDQKFKLVKQTGKSQIWKKELRHTHVTCQTCTAPLEVLFHEYCTQVQLWSLGRHSIVLMVSCTALAASSHQAYFSQRIYARLSKHNPGSTLAGTGRHARGTITLDSSALLE